MVAWEWKRKDPSMYLGGSTSPPAAILVAWRSWINELWKVCWSMWTDRSWQTYKRD